MNAEPRRRRSADRGHARAGAAILQLPPRRVRNPYPPMQLLSAMARVTTHLGLTATMSTSFYDPYHIARAFSTLDHISGGRAGWNVVTTGNAAEARNHGTAGLKLRSSRYDHADEVIEACMALWHTWEPDALRFDKQAGRQREFSLRLGDLLKKGESEANVMLQPGDVIIIPESMF